MPTTGIPGGPSFPSTIWDIVRAAARNDTSSRDTSSREALLNICRRYWSPLHNYIRNYIRRRGTPENLAEDLTQAFFQYVLEKEVLAKADPQKGSFRRFLLTTCRNFLITKWHDGQRDCLGRPWVPLGALQQDPADPDSEAEFDLDWACAVLKLALDAVRDQYAVRDQAERFDSLRCYLPFHDGELPGPQAEAAAAMGLTVEAYKKALHDLRAAFARQVRHEMAQTLSDPTAVEEEIHKLLDNVRRMPPTAPNGHPAPEATQ